MLQFDHQRFFEHWPTTLEGAPILIEQESFVDRPNLVLDPGIAYVICARGIREGWFTKRQLAEFVGPGAPPDYVGARQVVNGNDRDHEIAEIARGLEEMLRASEFT